MRALSKVLLFANLLLAIALLMSWIEWEGGLSTNWSRIAGGAAVVIAVSIAIVVWRVSYDEQRTTALLEVIAYLIPPRVNDEMIGDALEKIYCERKSRNRTWLIGLFVASTFFWVVINAVREVTTAVLGKNKPGSH